MIYQRNELDGLIITVSILFSFIFLFIPNIIEYYFTVFFHIRISGSNDVNVSISASKDKFRNAGELSENSSSRTASVLQALLLHIVVVALGSLLW